MKKFKQAINYYLLLRTMIKRDRGRASAKMHKPEQKCVI